MKYYSHLNTAVSILAAYAGNEPFHLFIKRFFSADKKFGSKDRRSISNLCYQYFRIGHAVKEMPAGERIILAHFLCENASSHFREQIKPEWNALIGEPLAAKIAVTGNPFVLQDIFPWQDELSESVEREKFSASFLTQPLLYLRFRPGKENVIKEKLTSAGLAFEAVNENCIALPNHSKAEQAINIDEEAVVQDLNSQQVLYSMGIEKKMNHPLVWDCCAASGGKAIQLYDIFAGDIDLNVSDIRPFIINNLKERFAKARVKKYKSFIADLTKDAGPWTIDNRPLKTFDLVVCDAPCTGSGTWSRTPEQLYYFKKENIAEYSARQKKIVSAVIPSLKPGGYFLYITCSVFRQENEAIVEFIKEKFHPELIKMELLKGYEQRADNMFVALFRTG